MHRVLQRLASQQKLTKQFAYIIVMTTSISINHMLWVSQSGMSTQPAGLQQQTPGYHDNQQTSFTDRQTDRQTELNHIVIHTVMSWCVNTQPTSIVTHHSHLFTRITLNHFIFTNLWEGQNHKI